MDENSDTSDESLDVTSERFDPLKALYSSKMQLPSSNAPIYDNVTKFENVMKGINSKPSKVRTMHRNHRVRLMKIRNLDLREQRRNFTTDGWWKLTA